MDLTRHVIWCTVRSWCWNGCLPRPGSLPTTHRTGQRRWPPAPASRPTEVYTSRGAAAMADVPL